MKSLGDWASEFYGGLLSSSIDTLVIEPQEQFDSIVQTLGDVKISVTPEDIYPIFQSLLFLTLNGNADENENAASRFYKILESLNSPTCRILCPLALILFGSKIPFPLNCFSQIVRILTPGPVLSHRQL